MRKSIYVFCIIFCLVGLFLCYTRCSTHSEEQEAASDSIPILITQVQRCAKLYTAEYHIHKIVTHEDGLHLKGSFLQKLFDIKLPVGERKIAIPMQATLKAYIDFSNFSEQDVERQGKHITIYLPDPKVVMTSSKIQQEKIREYVPLMRSSFTDRELSDYELQGRASIIQSIPRLGILKMAQANAARVLVPMIRQMGYQESDITITFRKEYQEKDLKGMVEDLSLSGERTNNSIR